jgi:hypothetical protein
MISYISSAWQFRLDAEATWRPIAVPGCWEQLGIPATISGPAWYRTRFTVPAEWQGRRLWLRFGGVSYHCLIYVNSQHVGEHTGLWDAFAVEITAAVSAGAEAELLVRVEKPAGLARGPDSTPLPGRFPLRETLSGFLPYVAGQIFGGIWQDVELRATGQVVFEDVWVRGDAEGRVRIAVALSAAAAVAVELREPGGDLLATLCATATDDTRRPTPDEGPPIGDDPASGRSSLVFSQSNRAIIETTIPQPRPWSPADPALYEARLRIADGDERVVRFGLRSLRADGATLLLNGRPSYPRMALTWGWYPDLRHCNPGPERARADFARLRSLGYNGVKVCLWFPPQYYFDLADELGMLLWVELPMWSPAPTAFFHAQTPAEYQRLVLQARNHPSVVLYTLGCELSSAVDAATLAPLYALVKASAGDALVRDNSGSGEAYGGLLNEFAEFYDHHFYSDLQHFRGLLDAFAPRWRPMQPWLFGEFCDYDTFRDLRGLGIGEQRSGIEGQSLPWSRLPDPWPLTPDPWWTLDDPERNPQGARWQYDLPFHAARLRANGMGERGEELERVSWRQALWHRKYTLELARLYREVSGYVVSGAADTPITTAGMWDDLDRLKFAPGEFRAFNDDLVALVGWDRRRAWIDGGDRAAHWDVWSYPSGATVRPHVIASHYGAATAPARVAWSAAFAGQPPFAAGAHTTPFALTPGTLRELAVAEFRAPDVAAPRQATFQATVQVGDEQAHNTWPLWFFPRDPWHGVADVALVDPSGRLRDLARMAPGIEDRRVDRPASVVIATAWSPEVASFVERGGRAVLLQESAGPPGPLPTAAMPFWRESIRLAERHPAWGDFPLDDALGAQFFGCATDCALDLAAFPQARRPILRRLDARTMALHEYAVELDWGAGRLIVTTLRFEGGQGTQPLGIARNTAAAYLLGCWVRYLRGSGVGDRVSSL